MRVGPETQHDFSFSVVEITKYYGIYLVNNCPENIGQNMKYKYFFLKVKSEFIGLVKKYGWIGHACQVTSKACLHNVIIVQHHMNECH